MNPEFADSRARVAGDRALLHGMYELMLLSREIDRVGGTRPVPVDIRIIATSNRNMEDEVRNGKFREDLYYRLNVLSLQIPPLRERLEDIPLLALHFLKKHADVSGKPPLSISKKALKTLQMHNWPGNVRELENVMARAMVMCNADKIEEDCIVLDGSLNKLAGSPPALSNIELKAAIKEHVRKVLNLAGGNRREAKRLLNVSRSYLYTIIDELKADGIDI